MRQQTLILALVLITSAAGCTARLDPPPTSPTPAVHQAATPAPVTAPAPPPPTADPPPPAPVAQATRPDPLCAPIAGHEDQPRIERLDALAGRLTAGLAGTAPEQAGKAIQNLVACVTIDVAQGSNGRFLVVELASSVTHLPPDRIAVWHHDSVWYATRFPEFDEFGSLPSAGQYRERSDGAEVLSVLRNQGSGQAGAFVLLHFSTEIKVLWRSPLYGYFHERILNDGLLLATHRDSGVYHEPHYYWGGCCYPTTAQVLWEREGDGFVLRAERTYPSILRTASAFAGAWNEQNLEAMRRYVVSEEALQAMLADPDRPEQISLGLDRPENLIPVELAEAAHWDALPAAYNGPAPVETKFVWPASPRPVALRRIDGQWLVAGIWDR